MDTILVGIEGSSGAERAWEPLGISVMSLLRLGAGRGVRTGTVCLIVATCAALLAVGQDAAEARAVAAVSTPALHVTVSSPAHKPGVNVPWPVRITVADASGKPIAATLTMRVLFAGQQVGTIDKGAVYRFVGTWQERKGNAITFPAAARGEPLTIQFVVKAQGVTVRKDWAITVT
jgi:hypothetical protein